MLLAAKRSVEGQELDIRTILMIGWKIGAYQIIETALSILESRGFGHTTIPLKYADMITR